MGVRISQRQILCRSYTRSPARYSNIPSNWLTPIVTAPTTARSAKPNIHSQLTVSAFVLPYLRSSLTVIALFLIARLLRGQTLQSAAATTPPPMPYQRGQFWVRRFRAQAEALCATLAALTQPAPAPDFLHRALAMLEIDENGLDEMDKRILETLVHKFGGKPVGINSLAVAVGEEADTLEEVYEPFLIQEGYLKRTPQGRVPTELAYQKLGVKDGAKQDNLL